MPLGILWKYDIDIMQDSYRPSVKKLELKRNGIFMQDNDPKHCSKTVK